MKRYALMFLLSLSAAAFVGCPGDGPDPDPDPVPMDPDGGMADAGTDPDGGTPDDTEFTSFVKSQIENRTTDATLPETIDDKTFTDAEDPAAFPASFFQ